MPKLTFHGGVNEIGGNKILLDSGTTRIFLDFGMSFGQAGKYFSEFLQPRKSNGIGDFIEMGLLPDIKGIYRKDYLEHVGLKFEKEPFVHGVFLSHAHADHSAYIHHLRHDIPVFSTQESIAILQAIEDTGQTGFADFLNIKETFQIRKSKRGDGFVRIQGEESKIPRMMNIMGGTVKIDNIEVEHVPVNHSLPGACGFLINIDGKCVVYTGDLRFHGREGQKTEEFVKKAGKFEPDVMICEGTRVDATSVETEDGVKEKSKKIIEKTKELVVVNFPVRDIDRMNTFYEISKETGRVLVISLKQAYLLEILKKTGCKCPDIDNKDISIYIPRKGWGIWRDGRYPKHIQIADFDTWERELIERKNTVTWKEIRQNQKDFILRNDIFELKELIDIKPKKGSSYIRSIVEPFDPEMEMEYEMVLNWLNHFGLLPVHQIHCSGHANQIDLKRIIEAIAPKKLIPVHTEHPEIFEEIVPRGTEVVLPQVGKEIGI